MTASPTASPLLTSSPLSLRSPSVSTSTNLSTLLTSLASVLSSLTENINVNQNIRNINFLLVKECPEFLFVDGVGVVRVHPGELLLVLLRLVTRNLGPAHRSIPVTVQLNTH